MFTTLQTARKFCNIDDDFHADDDLLLHFIETAENSVEKNINRPLYACVGQDGLLPATIRQQILILVSTFYENRECISPVQMHALPKSFDWLASLDRHYHIM